MEFLNRKLMTARQAADYLSVSLATLRKIERSGLLLPYRTPGGHRRYSVSMLEEYLDRSRKTWESDLSLIEQGPSITEAKGGNGQT